jgi:hypothetical protein
MLKLNKGVFNEYKESKNKIIDNVVISMRQREKVYDK